MSLTCDVVVVQLIAICAEIFSHAGNEGIGDVLLKQEATKDWARVS